jgi:hypothetical protein
MLSGGWIPDVGQSVPQWRSGRGALWRSGTLPEPLVVAGVSAPAAVGSGRLWSTGEGARSVRLPSLPCTASHLR